MANIKQITAGSTTYDIAAKYDHDGNQITTKYVTMDTNQTVNGVKTFSQPVGITSSAQLKYNTTKKSIDFIFA
jgi:hypothetical protein